MLVCQLTHAFTHLSLKLTCSSGGNTAEDLTQQAAAEVVTSSSSLSLTRKQFIAERKSGWDFGITFHPPNSEQLSFIIVAIRRFGRLKCLLTSVVTAFSRSDPSRMSVLYTCCFSFLVLVVLPGAGGQGGLSKDHLDPNTRDWGDYSDLQGLGHGLGLEQDREEEEEEEGGRGREESSSSLSPELEFLSDFAGKKRLWVITAPSRNDHYLRMMEKQLEDMEQEGLNCRLAERDTYIVTIIQNAMMEGRVQKTTLQGDTTVESLDPDTVSKLLHYLELTNQDREFSMLVLKKNLRVSERFPYPVRVDAVLELIDQFPARKLEKMTRKVSDLRCKVIKKRVLVKKRKTLKKKKPVLGAQRRGNVTLVVAAAAAAAPQRKLPVDKKAVLKSKIQDILRGRSRFVIRKTPPTGGGGGGGGAGGGGGGGGGGGASTTRGKEEVELSTPDGAAKAREESNFKRYVPLGVSRGAKERERNPDDKAEVQKKTNSGKNKNSSKKKGKGKKGKKGKGRGKKSNSEASEKDKAAFRDFLEVLRGNRRLMVISTPNKDAALFVQLQKENRKQHCDLALRKITVATMLGQGRDTTLTLHHYHLDSEAKFSRLADEFPEPGMISLLRTELGLSSSDLFSMTVTDYDLKRNRVFEAPPAASALLEHVDGFPSRRPEREREKKSPSACSTDQGAAADNVLLRFASKRRLLLVSTPSKEDFSYQQQLSAFSGQDCPMGIRHFALLKLIGTGAQAKGTVELFPLNGRSHSQVDPLSRDAVNDLREQLKVNKEYFSMLVVGKDGDVKAWFPSPMWSLDNIYDLVDSLDLRVQEEKLQASLGIHCAEDRGGGGDAEDGGYRGYREEHAEERYRYHRGEDR
ncbi:Coiled-coil domain-containing protein 80 [Merluccius polli]|uniref:Coiled-coil domain-containing protein 80 n=1 Tax=Merluccius polli TaxID=89951 RepID=A0AA47P007_MERPO|nr:Coiled-coil domain-containing protein 80 [Merluccius polli]